MAIHSTLLHPVRNRACIYGMDNVMGREETTLNVVRSLRTKAAWLQDQLVSTVAHSIIKKGKTKGREKLFCLF